MKTRSQRQWIAAIAVVLSLCLPTDSYALFGRERAKLLTQADDAYIAAQQAGAEGRVLDEISILTEARARYGKILQDYPGYKTEEVDTRFQRCGAHLRIIAARIKSGEIAVPDPDAIVGGAGAGYVANNAIEASAPEPSQPAFISPMPPLVPTGKKPPTEAPVVPQEPAPPAEETPSATDFSKPMLSPASTTETDAANMQLKPPETKSALAQANDALRVMLINELIRAENAPEAVMLLEEVVEKEGDVASKTTRLLQVRALLECRNYKRAETELASLMLDSTPTPAMRSLASTIALQKGNLTEAMFQMDRLIQDYPAYSDAYINMAYLYYMMDPVANRDMAIVCYRSGLSYGAKRDPAFETALNVEIVK